LPLLKRVHLSFHCAVVDVTATHSGATLGTYNVTVAPSAVHAPSAVLLSSASLPRLIGTGDSVDFSFVARDFYANNVAGGSAPFKAEIIATSADATDSKGTAEVVDHLNGTCERKSTAVC
jgi:hypothetical protein